MFEYPRNDASSNKFIDNRFWVNSVHIVLLSPKKWLTCGEVKQRAPILSVNRSIGSNSVHQSQGIISPKDESHGIIHSSSRNSQKILILLLR